MNHLEGDEVEWNGKAGVGADGVDVSQGIQPSSPICVASASPCEPHLCELARPLHAMTVNDE